MEHAFFINAAVGMRAKIIPLGLGQIWEQYSRFNEFGLRLRFRDRQTILAQTFDMHADGGADIRLNFFYSRPGGDTPGQIRNIRGIVVFGFFDHHQILHLDSPLHSGLLIPLGMEHAFLVDSAVSVRAKIIALRLQQVCGKSLLAVAVNVAEGIAEGGNRRAQV